MKRRRHQYDIDWFVLLACVGTVCLLCAHSVLYLWRLYR